MASLASPPTRPAPPPLASSAVRPPSPGARRRFPPPPASPTPRAPPAAPPPANTGATPYGALVARALIENPQLIDWRLAFKTFYGLVATLLGSPIDKVNKPYLPIATGVLSVESALLLVGAFAVVGLSIGVSNFGSFITSLYCLGLFLGTIYSIPPFGLKRYPVAAFLIIGTVCGFLLNFGVYYATRAALDVDRETSMEAMYWTPPRKGMVKINVDTAFSPQAGTAAIGIVARNDQGCVIAAVSQPISSCQDAEEEEAEAILVGLELGFSLKTGGLMVASDCANAVAMANNTSSNYTRLWTIYKNIAAAKSLIPVCSASFIRRKLNSMAHDFAQLPAS